MIMDGNGRWAAERGLPRIAGHRAGVETVRRVIEAAPGLGVGVLTLYAFSEDNWSRPPREITALFGLLEHYLAKETSHCLEKGVRIEAIGRRDRLPSALLRAIEDSESRTVHCTRLHLRIALDYSSRSALIAAANSAPGKLTREHLSRALGPDVDLLIRTSGEQRLSDFLLWECAYAEFVFSQRHWPDFSAEDMTQAVTDFHRRERRFGGLTALAPEPALQTA
jgi:undecaprenyl diphosphate synthase